MVFAIGCGMYGYYMCMTPALQCGPFGGGECGVVFLVAVDVGNMLSTAGTQVGFLLLVAKANEVVCVIVHVCNCASLGTSSLVCG